MLQVYSGEEFNEKYKEYEFYKLLNKDLTHFEYTYKDGLNVDVNEFNPTGECLKGGLHFTEKNKIRMWINSYSFITKCIIPNDAKVYVETDEFQINRYKSDKLIVDVNNKVDIYDFMIWDCCKLANQKNNCSLECVKEQT